MCVQNFIKLSAAVINSAHDFEQVQTLLTSYRGRREKKNSDDNNTVRRHRGQ